MSAPKKPPKREQPKRDVPQDGQTQEPGSNSVEHEPDPDAQPIPDGEHRYIPRSPYTTGNY